MNETQTHTAEAGDVTTRGWLREGATIYTLIETGRMHRGSPVMRNENWFQVQGPEAEAVAERIHAALAPRAPAAVPEEWPTLSTLADWLVQHGGIGTWAASSAARALLLRENSPFRTLAAAPAAPPADGTDLHRRLVALLEQESVREGTFDDLARAILDTVAPPADGGTEGLREADDAAYMAAWNEYRWMGGPGYTDNSASTAFLEGWNAALAFRPDSSAPTSSAPAEGALWDAVHEVAICAWNLLDGTENDASGVYQADWDALSAAMDAMAALVPEEEQPFSPSYAVAYLRKLVAPAPAASAGGKPLS